MTKMKPGRHQHSQVIKVIVDSDRTSQHHIPLDVMHWVHSASSQMHHLCDSCQKSMTFIWSWGNSKQTQAADYHTGCRYSLCSLKLLRIRKTKELTQIRDCKYRKGTCTVFFSMGSWIRKEKEMIRTFVKDWTESVDWMVVYQCWFTGLEGWMAIM